MAALRGRSGAQSVQGLPLHITRPWVAWQSLPLLYSFKSGGCFSDMAHAYLEAGDVSPGSSPVRSPSNDLPGCPADEVEVCPSSSWSGWP